MGSLSQPLIYQLRSQILAYKHLVRNLPIPTALTVPTVHSNIWMNEREKLAQKAVTFYRDKIEKDAEMKNMITGNIKVPREESAQDEEISRYII